MREESGLGLYELLRNSNITYTSAAFTIETFNNFLKELHCIPVPKDIRTNIVDNNFETKDTLNISFKEFFNI